MSLFHERYKDWMSCSLASRSETSLLKACSLRLCDAMCTLYPAMPANGRMPINRQNTSILTPQFHGFPPLL